MQDSMNEDYFDIIHHRQERRRDAFLQTITARQDGICGWNGCDKQAETVCQLGTPAGMQEYHFCWEHFAEVQRFVIELSRYEKGEES